MRKSYTKYRLMAAFNNLLERYDYDDISVSMVTDMCGVSRQAFYKSFDSKQDLCAQMIITLFRDSLKGDRYFTWNSLILAYLRQVGEYMEFFHTLSTPDFERMAENGIYFHFRHLFDIMIRFRTGKETEPDLKEVLDFFCYGMARTFLGITRIGAEPDYERMMRIIDLSMPQPLKELLPGLAYPESVHRSAFRGHDESGLEKLREYVREFQKEKCTNDSADSQ